MEKILGAILIGGFALLFFVLGYLVWIKEKITLFHSYHYDKVAEENKKAWLHIWPKAAAPTSSMRTRKD